MEPPAIIALRLDERPELGAALRAAIDERVKVAPAIAAVTAHVDRVAAAGGEDVEALAVAWAAVATLGWLAPVDVLRDKLAALPVRDSTVRLLRARAEVELDAVAALRAGTPSVPRAFGPLFAAHWLGDARHAVKQGRAAVQALRDGPYSALELFEDLVRRAPAVAARFEVRLVGELPPQRVKPALVGLGAIPTEAWSPRTPAGLAATAAIIMLVFMVRAFDRGHTGLGFMWLVCAGISGVVGAGYLYWYAPREARRQIARLGINQGLTADCIAALITRSKSTSSVEGIAPRLVAREPGLRLLCATSALAAATAEAGSAPTPRSHATGGGAQGYDTR